MRKSNAYNLFCKTHRLIFLTCFGIFFQLTIAQNVITGTVTDSNGIPLPSVNVIEKGTENGTVTDFDGFYSITVSGDAILVFNYIGFVAQEKTVNETTTLNVQLQEDLQSLSEVVVIGYGSRMKEEISGAVATVEVEDLETIPQVSIDQMIQGRAAGVSVTTNSGQPGAAVSVRIRGVNSISGSSEPLYIIDGVPVSGESQPGGSSPLNTINQNDIENISVLKDASATAIYGSRGSNGVVIITTKQGKKGKAKVSINSFIGIQEPTNLIDVMNLQQYATLQNAINEIYNLDPIVAFTNPELLGPGTNWQQEIFSNATMYSNQVSFQGGTEDINYFISGGNLSQDGTVIASGFERSTVRANIDAKLNDRIKVGINLTASRTDEQITLNGRSDGIIGLSLLNNPAIPVYNPDGSFAGPSLEDDFRNENPVAKALNLRNNLQRDRILGNIYADIKVVENLTFRTEFGGDFQDSQNSQFTPTYSYGEIEVENNTLSIANNYSDFWIIKNFLTYSNTFKDKHSLSVLLGSELQEASYGGVTTTDGNFVGNDFPILGTGDADDNSTQFQASNALESYFTRMIYSFDSRYNVTASLRADGSSRFAEGNKWGYFPSLSGAWRLSNESFMEDFKTLQNIKIYGGYGEVGNENIPNFAYGSNLNPANTGLGTGFLTANFANPDLTWESSTQTNLGFDFSVFKNSLNVNLEVYNKVSKDFLFRFASTNFSTGGMTPGAVDPPWVNLGEMVNRGVDVTLNFNSNPSKEFTYSSMLTVSHYRNEVTDLGDVPQINGAMNINYDGQQNITITREGSPIGLFYGLEVEGIFRNINDIQGAPIQFGRPFEDALFGTTWLGDIKFKDQNGDGVVDDNDRVVIGNPHPDFTFGFQNNFRYKGFDLSVFFQGSYGNDVFNGIDRLLTAGNRTFTNQATSVLDYWSLDNPDGNQPRLARNDTRNIEISDRYVEDGSYVRIQNLTLGYTLKSDWTDQFGINLLKVYGSVQNLYTFTNYSGYDPEIGSFNQNTLLTGIDAGRYPSPRTFTMGINLEF